MPLYGQLLNVYIPILFYWQDIVFSIAGVFIFAGIAIVYAVLAAVLQTSCDAGDCTASVSVVAVSAVRKANATNLRCYSALEQVWCTQGFLLSVLHCHVHRPLHNVM